MILLIMQYINSPMDGSNNIQSKFKFELVRALMYVGTVKGVFSNFL